MTSGPPSSARGGRPRASGVARANFNRGVHHPRVIAAIEAIPAGAFGLGQADSPPLDLPTPPGSTNGETPFVEVVALMVQALDLQGHERVLDIGTGTGYQAALLSRLARAVYSIEPDPQVAETARKTLHKLGFINVHVIDGDGTQGWPSRAPYEAILVGAALPEIPNRLLHQLEDGGRFVVPLGGNLGQLVERLRKNSRALVSETVTWCKLPPLVREGAARNSSYPWMRAVGEERLARHK